MQTDQTKHVERSKHNGKVMFSRTEAQLHEHATDWKRPFFPGRRVK